MPKEATFAGRVGIVEATDEQRAVRTEAFREWLRVQLDRTGMSLHGIEVSAGIRGNAVGKFLRGERGQRHSLTPLMIRRLAPILGLSEETMLSRAGHMSHQPGDVSVETAILADSRISFEDKRFLIDLYRKVVGNK
jgi:hypothetical protein